MSLASRISLDNSAAVFAAGPNEAVTAFDMRVLVTGANGQLGYDIVRLLSELDITCRGVDIEELDITDAEAVSAYVANYAPTHIVHCAAYTAVDRAESEPEKAMLVNVTGTKNLAAAAKNAGARFMYFSTDYVYGGGGNEPFTVTSPTAPLNKYGETKLMGEQAAAEELEGDNALTPALWQRLTVVRTSWVFGLHGGNFVKTMLRLGRERERLTVVADQVGSPTYTRDLARCAVDMLLLPKYPAGVFHATNEGYCSWYDFACAILKSWNVPCEVVPIKTSEYKTAAVRPLNSRLDKSCLDAIGVPRLPSWQDALARYLMELH